jgi:hypothetical protein
MNFKAYNHKKYHDSTISLSDCQICNMSEEDRQIYVKYKNKKDHAGASLQLSFEEYKHLMVIAGITAIQIGSKSGMFQLARYNDSGNYISGNCRFITQANNLKEMLCRRTTEQQRSTAMARWYP